MQTVAPLSVSDVGLLLFVGAAVAVGLPGWSPRSAQADVVHTGLAAGEPFHRGIVKAVHSADLSSDLNVPVLSVGFREGERFKAGDDLIVFDCGRQQHELEALSAQAREMQVAVDTSDYLVRNGAGNRNDAATAKARFDRANAEVAGLEHHLRRCRIAAPFDGVVTELSINPHEVPRANQPFMQIVSHKLLEIEIIVPSRLMARSAAGTKLDFRIDETGRAYAAVIRRIGGAVDPVSQTGKVYAALLAPDDAVLPGMSGTAVFAVTEER
ncbi:MAG: efflux RND transporter periplasmic adaptor subunit [Hyphomicrobiaceae bacterium]